MQATWIVIAGLGVGTVFGMFGAGGSAFATPVLALLGVPAAIAVASPLPAMLPASVVGARRYLRTGALDTRTAVHAVAGGVPGTILGAFASNWVGGPALLVLSGVMLLVVGARILAPDPAGHAARASARRDRTGFVLALAFMIGVLTGLLANGGGFLLMPAFILVLGLSATKAAGTSMVAVGALTIPTLAVHMGLGHVDWTVALAFAAGLVPGSLAGSRMATRIPAAKTRRAFGVGLVIFAAVFLVQLAT
ncbi:MAG TPA: sulfite exporter TauE/SafE family protein [Acidimicrobiia bacterium]|nr:sulfite exporter TauE/SafE family protein [Acidimicrobiia bacterium]